MLRRRPLCVGLGEEKVTIQRIGRLVARTSRRPSYSLAIKQLRNARPALSTKRRTVTVLEKQNKEELDSHCHSHFSWPWP